MKEFIFSKLFIYLFLFSIIINISICLQNYMVYTVEFNRTQNELGKMQIKTNDEICPFLIPSLFLQILLLPRNANTTNIYYLYDYKFKIPILDYYFQIMLLRYSFLNKYNDFFMGKVKFDLIIQNCYFGLSYGNDSNEIEEKYFVLNQLYNRSQIKEKIFSFDKWAVI